ncbi:MAG: response regulator [Desulfobacterales bacterium]|nr:response regulator [Desulfobacterales bacterium]
MVEPGKPKVLIVDDMVSNISLLTNLLKEEYETFFAKNGVKALEIAEKKRPDCILLDIVMPEMDGYEVCRRIKENPDTRDIPVLFVSALGQNDDGAKGIETGAADYIVKPFKPLLVKTRVATHVKLKLALEELRRLQGA